MGIPSSDFLIVVMVSIALAAVQFTAAGLLARYARRLAGQGRFAGEILATLSAFVCVCGGMFCLTPIMVLIGV